MAKRKKYESWQTTDSRIKSYIQKLWLWSNERRTAEKEQDRTCCECGKKKSQAKGREVKIELHHIKEVDFQRIYKVIREELLVHPSKIKVLCVDCHARVHGKERKS